MARQHNVSVRTGCFCNPGAGEVAFTISRETLVGGVFGEAWASTTTCAPSVCRQAERFAPRSGSPSHFADVHRFMRFAAEFVDLTGVPDDLPPRATC